MVDVGSSLAEGAKLAVHSNGVLFYKQCSEGVMVFNMQESQKWEITSFTSLQNVADMWDEVHTWL